MRTSPLRFKRELDRAALQVQGMLDHAELGKGMPYSIERIEAVIAALLAALSRQRRIRNASKLATSRLRRILAELHAKQKANLVFAASKIGANSAELTDLGGKPRVRLQPVADTVVDAPAALDGKADHDA